MAKARKLLEVGDPYWVVSYGTPNEMKDEPAVRTRATAKQHVLAHLGMWVAWTQRYDLESYDAMTTELMETKKLESVVGYEFERHIGGDTGWTVRLTAREETYQGGPQP